MKLGELNEPFLPGWGVWLEQPPGLCWMDKAFTAGEHIKCYSTWNYGRLTNEFKSEDIDPRAPCKHNINTPTYLIEQVSSEKLCQLIWAWYGSKQGFLQLLLCWMESRQRKRHRIRKPYHGKSGLQESELLFPKGRGQSSALRQNLSAWAAGSKTGSWLIHHAFHRKATFEETGTLKGPIFSTRVWKKNRSYEVQWGWVGWGLAQETEDYILHHSFCFLVSSALICDCRPHICYFYHSRTGKILTNQWA